MYYTIDFEGIKGTPRADYMLALCNHTIIVTDNQGNTKKVIKFMPYEIRCKHIDTYESDDTGVKVDYISIKQDEYFKEYIKYNWMFIPYSYVKDSYYNSDKPNFNNLSSKLCHNSGENTLIILLDTPVYTALNNLEPEVNNKKWKNRKYKSDKYLSTMRERYNHIYNMFSDVGNIKKINTELGIKSNIDLIVSYLMNGITEPGDYWKIV